MCKSKFKTLQEARRLFQEPEVADPEELEVIAPQEGWNFLFKVHIDLFPQSICFRWLKLDWI